jgi:predicted negative regulator of RcsB-dependent stress response
MEADKEKDAVLFEHLGDIYHSLGNIDKAREFWQESLAVEANPKVKERLDKLSKP